MIEFSHVSLTYPYEEYALLKDLTFTLTDGVNTVLCDTQSGKSSICKLLTKQFAATSGQITVDRQEISSITNQGLGILYLSDNLAFFERRSVRYNVTYPLTVRKVPKVERNKRFDEVAEQLGLTDPDVNVKKLPLPERKRVALSRGLTVPRKMVLLDDFCSDTDAIDKVVALFGNATIVIFTSNVNLARGNVVVLDGGNTVYQGDAEGAAQCKQTLSWIIDMNISRSE